MTEKKRHRWFRNIFSRSSKENAKSPAFKENRRVVRSYLEAPLQFTLGSETVNATTFDISEQGLYVRTTRLPKVGMPVKAEFTLPGERKVVCSLKVVWVNDYSSTALVINGLRDSAPRLRISRNRTESPLWRPSKGN